MDHRLIEGLMEALAPTVREYVSQRFDAVQGVVAAEVAKAIAIVPKEADIERIVSGEFQKAVTFQQEMESNLSALVERVAGLEKVEPPSKGDPGEPGLDGKDADPDEIVAKVLTEVICPIADQIERAVTALPKPVDGVSVTPDDVRPMLEEMVQRAIAGLPEPQNGKDADPQEVAALILSSEQMRSALEALPKPVNGKDAEPVTRELTIEALRAMPELPEMVETAVFKRLVEQPPKDGEPGPQGERGPSGEPGRDGRDGLPGVPGAKGLDGTNGLDGLGFDDMAVEYDGERTLNFKWSQGERIKEYSARLPIPIDRAVWKQGDWQRGDGVSYGGSWFIAQCDTTEQPEKSRDWRMAAKRGRDGKDGKIESAKSPTPIALK